MKWLQKLRFRMATAMMLVATCGAASALFVKVRDLTPDLPQPYFRIDAPVLFIVAIGSTAIALGSLKSHTASQTMLQAMLACLGFSSLIWLAENKLERPLLYWFQASFALLVAIPLLARSVVKTHLERGPRRNWWKKTFEAFVFAFLTMLLALLGILLQFAATQLGGAFVK
jgi:hypothetical protein